MKNILIISMLILVFFSSCKKEYTSQVSSGVPRMLELLGVPNADKNGLLSITSQKTFDSYSNAGKRGFFMVNGKFWDKDGVTQQYGSLSMDSFTLAPLSAGDYQSTATDSLDLKSLFGKTVAFQVDKGDTEQTLVLQSGFYVPEDIIVSSPIKTVNDQRLPKNTMLGWNPDAQNTKGIFILIEFDPEEEENDAFNDGTHTYLYNLIQTEDDGFFTLTPDNFSGMPVGAKIKLWIGRNNSTIIDDADGINKYALHSYTIATDNFILAQ